MSVDVQINRMFNAKSVPINLQSGEIDHVPRRRAFSSRVRKLSKRLSTTFKSSFTIRENEVAESEGFNDTAGQSNEPKDIPRVFSLENFKDINLYKDQQQQQQKHGSNNILVKNESFSSFDLATRNNRLMPGTGFGGFQQRGSSSSIASGSKTPPQSPYGKLDQYTKLEQLGEGSYAIVYKGVSKINNAIVALKEIRLQEEEGIPFTAIREASLLKDLNHANIVRLHDIIPAKEHLVLVFEYVHTDLCMFLEERPFGLHSQNVRLLLFQLLRALNYIHQKSILHRDIKPQNVLLSNQGELKLADFGLARAKSVPSRTYTNEIVTLWYRPPDVLLGSTDYTTSLDIWGVGCIFVEIISGFPLFPGVKSAHDQLTKIFRVTGTPPKDVWPRNMKKSTYERDDFSMYQKESLGAQVPRLRTQLYAEELAERMLQFDPKKRITAAESMKHQYFSTLPVEIHTLPDALSIFTLPGLKLADDHRRPDMNRPNNRHSSSHYV